MKTKAIILATLLAAAGGASVFAAAPAASGTAARVTVNFVDPQKFTDLKYDTWQGTSTGLMDQLRSFMVRTGQPYVPAGMHLDIKVTNVDLAGEFEPWRGPNFDDIRIVRSVYPPRINLEYTLTGPQGNVVKSGKSDLFDPGFQLRIAWPQDDYLRYEKSMLRDWFSTEFRDVGRG